jgi:hypothetical protein
MRRHADNSTADYHSVTLAKLNSLQRLADTDPMSEHQRQLLERRIAREWISVGYWHLSNRRRGKAFGAFLEGARRGRRLSAAKGIVYLLTGRGRHGDRLPPSREGEAAIAGGAGGSLRDLLC